MSAFQSTKELDNRGGQATIQFRRIPPFQCSRSYECPLALRAQVWNYFFHPCETGNDNLGIVSLLFHLAPGYYTDLSNFQVHSWLQHRAHKLPSFSTLESRYWSLASLSPGGKTWYKKLPGRRDICGIADLGGSKATRKLPYADRRLLLVSSKTTKTL